MFKHGFLSYALVIPLLGIGFTFPVLWPLSFLGIALFTQTALSLTSHKRTALYAYICGVGFSTLALAAIFIGILPLDWYGITSVPFQIAMAVGSLFFAAAVLGSHFVVFALCIRTFKTNSWRDVLIFPSLWVLCEWIGSWIFYLVFIGPGAYFGAHFTLTRIGYLLAEDRVLLQSAWFGGIYGLSFILAFIGTLLMYALYEKDARSKRRYQYVLISLFLLWAGTHALPVYKHSLSNTLLETTKTIRTGVVSRYTPPLINQTQKQQDDFFEAAYTLVKPLRDIELLVFPENTTFLRTIRKESRQDVLENLRKIGVSGQAPLIIDSEDERNGDGVVYSKVTYAQEGHTSQVGYKQYLLPLGEYLPNVYLLPLQIFSSDELMRTILEIRGYQSKEITGQGIINGVTVATRFCDEMMSPELYRKTTLDGAEILINISSLSWFHWSPIVYEQVKRVGRVRAVENGRWYVQSGNLAPAFVLNQHGDIVAETLWNKESVIEISVPPTSTKTPYTLIGSWVLLLPFLTVLCLLSTPRLFIRKSPK